MACMSTCRFVYSRCRKSMSGRRCGCTRDEDDLKIIPISSRQRASGNTSSLPVVSGVLGVCFTVGQRNVLDRECSSARRETEQRRTADTGELETPSPVIGNIIIDMCNQYHMVSSRRYRIACSSPHGIQTTQRRWMETDNIKHMHCRSSTCLMSQRMEAATATEVDTRFPLCCHRVVDVL